MKDLSFVDHGAISDMQPAKEKGAVAVQDAVLITPTHVPESYVHSLSNLDQLNVFPPCYLPILYFFRSGAESPSSATKLIASLKQALADALELYPVVAGRLRKGKGERLEVEVNGAGIEFSVATTEARLDAWEDLRFCSVASQLVPNKSFMCEEMVIGAPLACVQVTIFQCGGFAICSSFLHALGDMQALSEFVETWARAACIHKLGHGTTPFIDSPRLDTAALIRPRDPPAITAPIDALVQICGDQHPDRDEEDESEAGIVTAAALLRMGDAKVAEAVREVETGPYSYGRASSFEAVAGLLWVAITRARGLPADARTSFALPVNMRQRWRPALPPRFFGNATLPAMATARSGELLERHFSYAARLMHESIVAIDAEYGRAAVDWLETQLQQRGRVRLRGMLTSGRNLHASVMVAFPLYQVDFGWGRATHVSLPLRLVLSPRANLNGNMVVTSSPRGGRTRDFLLFLKIQHMRNLLADPSFSHYLRGEEQVVEEIFIPPPTLAKA